MDLSCRSFSLSGVGGEAAAEGVFGADAGQDEVEKVFMSASLGADAGEAEAAKGLAGDQGASDSAVEVEIAERDSWRA